MVPRFVSSGRSDNLVTCVCYGSWVSSESAFSLGLRSTALCVRNMEACLLITFFLTARFTNLAPVHVMEAWSGLYSTFAGIDTLYTSNIRSTHIPPLLCLSVQVKPFVRMVQSQVVPFCNHPLGVSPAIHVVHAVHVAPGTIRTRRQETSSSASTVPQTNSVGTCVIDLCLSVRNMFVAYLLIEYQCREATRSH